MKASELIEEIQVMINELGDCNITIRDYYEEVKPDGYHKYGKLNDVTHVSFAAVNRKIEEQDFIFVINR